MNYKKELLKENKKALQFLHHAHGFDFEQEIFIGGIPGRFTYKTVCNMIAAHVGGSYTAAILVKPARAYTFQKLHYATLENGRFKIDHDRRAVKYWRYDIDDFFGVGVFENIRKNLTKRVYIIAQKTELLRTPKPEKKPEENTRYNIAKNGIHTTGDGRGNRWVDKIELLPRDGSREKIEFSPYHTFYGGEKRSDNAGDHIDKSGYILRFRRMDLHGRAKKLKADRQRAAVLAFDWSEREKQAAAQIAEAKKHIASMIENAETYADVKKAENKIRLLYWTLFDNEAVNAKNLPTIESKNRYFNEIEKRVNEILTGGTEQ